MNQIYKTFGNVTYIFKSEEDVKKAAKLYIKSTRIQKDVESKFIEAGIDYCIKMERN